MGLLRWRASANWAPAAPIPVAFDPSPSIRCIADLQQPKMSGLPPPDYTLNEVGRFSRACGLGQQGTVVTTTSRRMQPHSALLLAAAAAATCSPPPAACLPTSPVPPLPPAPPCQAGERVIAASRRPDGTVRKERRVRAGYVPQDEQAVYVSRGAAVSRPGAAAGTSLWVCGSSAVPGCTCRAGVTKHSRRALA